ncbi:hypothetical protein F5884DRAFT_172511 [Xylogone sp. PMI_703]|nr:hypothetical protein F5884DRAFT_172511 [Xylogone sp. PMI_703]
MAERWQRSSESPPRRGKEPYRAQRSGPVRRRSGSETDSIYSSSSSSSSYIDTSRYYPQNRFSLRKFFTAPSERRRIRKRRSQRSIRRGGSSSSIDSDLAYGTGWIHKHKENSPRHEKEPERPRPQGYEEGDVRRDGVERREGQEVRDQRWRHDQYEARETPERRDQPERSEGQRRREKGKPGKRISRSPTAAEILAVGNEIQELSDLISSGGRPRRSGGFTRGIPPSKVSSQHQVEDDDDWRTDDGHESADSVDSSLAYGGESSQGGGGWFGFSWGKPKPKPELKPEPRPEPRPVPKQKSSVVDPRLFGRQNSLNGIVTEPVGFGDVNYRPPINGFGSSRDQSPLATKSKAPSTPTPRSKSKPKSTVSDIPLQTVYPISTEDPQVFEPGRSSVSSSVRQEPYMPSRPAPPPIYHPQPITPVTQAIYDPHYAARIESAPLPKDSSRRGPSIAEAALAGVAAGAVGAAIASESKEERDGRRREDDRGLYDDSYGSKHRDPGQYQNKGDKSRDNYEGTKDRDYRSERRNEQNQTNEPRVSDEPSRREDYNKQPGVDRREQRDEKRRGETREERRARHREERRLRDSRDSQNTTYDTLEKTSKTPRDEQPSRSTVVSEAIPEAPGPLNPFQYQVADDAFPTPNISRPSSRPTRSETIPIVHTVEREPSFVLKRSESAKEQVSTQGPKPDIISRAAEQLSRSARIKDKPREEASIPEYGSSMKYNGEDDRKRQGSGKRARKDSRDGELRKAEEIYNEVEHSTAPIDAAAIAAAAAVVANETHGKSKSRKRRSGRHGEQRDEPREFDSERRAPELYSRQEKPEERYDAGPERQDSESTKEDIESARILDEADKAYREIVMARKIASSVIRSRSSSPDRSVVSKYKEKEEEEVVRIVTPPSMEDHKRAGPYDAPNADIRLDHILIPQELPTFVIPNIEPDTFYPVARDPDAERERPLLTLIRPTPIPSPIPEKQATTDHKPIEQPSIEREIQRVVPDAVPESTVDVEAAANGTSPSEIEPEPTSFSEQRREQRSDVVEDISQPEKKKPKGKKGSRWSMIASGIIGGVAGATIEGDAETSESKSEKEPRDHEKSIVQLPAPPEVVAVFQDRPQEAVADPPDAITAEEEFLDSNFDREEGVPEDTYRILDFSAQDNSVEDKTFEEKLDNVTETNVQEGLAAHDSKDGSHNFDKTWPTGSGGVMTDQEESTAVAPENNPPDAIYSDDAYQNEPVNIEMQPFDEVSDEKAEQPNSISNDQEDVPFQHEYNNEVDQQIIPLDDKNRVLDREPREPKGMPGSFTEDLGFIATLAAGLQDTGLNPNIVINDPSYLRRTSPPGSNDEGDNLVDKEGLPARVGKTAQRKRDRESEDQLGVVLPLEEALPSAEVAEEDVSAIDTSKLSKKEQKKPC